MPTVYLQSVKNPELKFKVLKFDPATKTATIKGTYGNFEITPFTKEKVVTDGYTLVSEPDPAS
jgi:hypothetical protein